MGWEGKGFLLTSLCGGKNSIGTSYLNNQNANILNILHCQVFILHSSRCYIKGEERTGQGAIRMCRTSRHCTWGLCPTINAHHHWSPPTKKKKAFIIDLQKCFAKSRTSVYKSLGEILLKKYVWVKKQWCEFIWAERTPHLLLTYYEVWLSTAVNHCHSRGKH